MDKSVDNSVDILWISQSPPPSRLRLPPPLPYSVTTYIGNGTRYKQKLIATAPPRGGRKSAPPGKHLAA